MYTIILNFDGKYHCEGRYQDGHDNWVENTLEEAVESMKKFAWTMNHDKLKKKNIEILEAYQEVVTRYRPLRK